MKLLVHSFFVLILMLDEIWSSAVIQSAELTTSALSDFALKLHGLDALVPECFHFAIKQLTVFDQSYLNALTQLLASYLSAISYHIFSIFVSCIYAQNGKRWSRQDLKNSDFKLSKCALTFLIVSFQPATEDGCWSIPVKTQYLTD